MESNRMKKEAKKLVDRFYDINLVWGKMYTSKQCALICIDEMLGVCSDEDLRTYCEDLRREIIEL